MLVAVSLAEAVADHEGGGEAFDRDALARNVGNRAAGGGAGAGGSESGEESGDEEDEEVLCGSCAMPQSTHTHRHSKPMPLRKLTRIYS